MRLFNGVTLMMKLAHDLDLKAVTIRWKHDGGNSFATAIFSNAAIREFDDQYPHRTHIEVYVDEEEHALGFKILSSNKYERHAKQVAVTKAIRKLNITEFVSQVELIFDPEQELYIAKL